MRYALICLAVLLGGSTAVASQSLEVELVCEGEMFPRFDNDEAANKYRGGMVLRRLFENYTGIPSRTDKFQRRVSIKNDEIIFSDFWEDVSGLPITVSDNAITSSLFFKSLGEEKGFELDARLDRLTGAFVISFDITSQELSQSFSEETGFEDLMGIRISGTCEKLDPTKKKF